ncbi:MAG: hypothetical protein AB7J34_08990 [Limisphaerales bacterium]
MDQTHEPKRPYNKRNLDYWKNKKSTNRTESTPPTNSTTVTPEKSPKVSNRFGLQLNTQEDLIQKRIRTEEMEQYKKFHRMVVPEFKRFLSEIQEDVTPIDPDIVIPKSLGKVITDYCREWKGESETILDRFSECTLRTFVGLMTLVEMSGETIRNLRLEIVTLQDELKSTKTDSPSPITLNE